jgi:anthranilate synthase component 1
MSIKLKTNYIKTLSDIHTPVEMYLKIRDKFPNSFLLESSDYRSKENSYSYLCLDPIAYFKVCREKIEISLPNNTLQVSNTADISIEEQLYSFSKLFSADDLGFDFITNGLFGYTSYDAIPLFEEIEFSNKDFSLPLMQYHVFKYIIVFNHFNNELYLIEHLLEGESSQLHEIQDLIDRKSVHRFNFQQTGQETSNFTDDDFLKAIKIGIDHCLIGDVFQVVFSRKFKFEFKGDEFNVYRALRSVNPSPYLFYFDYGDFKIFGSSPEAQLTIKNQYATINPIAGTFRRTGNLVEDEKLAHLLSKDPKENAEHIMLVDLARNDLSRNSKKVHVESFKQVEYYSHVIHLVSKVKALLDENYNPVKILGDTYPAGTLSGAPKHRAMQIIDSNEPNSRGFYGGAIGYMGFNGEYNHAIFIRSFLSHQNQLHFQAGCGIVAKSSPKNELQEVNNKLMALRKSIELAKTI